MTREERPRKAVNEILEVYRGLRERLASLTSVLEKGGERATVPAVSEELRDLRSLTERLFRYEEEGGLFEELLALAPHENARIEKVKKEHPILLKAIDALVSKMGIDAPELRRLRKELRSFVHALGSHEERETNLAQRPYYTEEGTVD